jgi:hypothetical protein
VEGFFKVEGRGFLGWKVEGFRCVVLFYLIENEYVTKILVSHFFENPKKTYYEWLVVSGF